MRYSTSVSIRNNARDQKRRRDTLDAQSKEAEMAQNPSKQIEPRLHQPRGTEQHPVKSMQLSESKSISLEDFNYNALRCGDTTTGNVSRPSRSLAGRPKIIDIQPSGVGNKSKS